MGNLISRGAARDKIVEDATTTVTDADARAKAGQPKAELYARAGQRLSPLLNLYKTVHQKRDDALATVRPLVATRRAQDAAADDQLYGHYDLAWNEVGRPAHDVFLDVLYPGGASFYAKVPIDEQPVFMELLAELLEGGVHPGLDAVKSAARAGETRASAATLEAANDAVRKPLARYKLYDRVLTALGQGVHIELARLKKSWLADGLSEADVHQIIPDRPRSYGVTKDDEPVVDET